MSEIQPDNRLTLSGSQACKNLASMCNVDPREVAAVLTNMVMPGASGAEMIAFSMVCVAYNLDPLKKQIYAFKNKHGVWFSGLYVDGWITVINRHPDFAGMKIAMDWNPNTKKPHSVTVTICTKSRPDFPTVVTEYYDECRGGSEMWAKWPSRMLRHKGIIQAARVAFGFPGLSDIQEVRDLDDETRRSEGLLPRSNASVSELNRMLAAPAPDAFPAPAPEREAVPVSRAEDPEPLMTRGREFTSQSDGKALPLSDDDIESLLEDEPATKPKPAPKPAPKPKAAPKQKFERPADGEDPFDAISY